MKTFRGYSQIIFILFFLRKDFRTKYRKEYIYLIHNWFRSNCSQIFYKIDALKNFSKIHRKRPLLGSLSNKAASLKAWNFIKKRPQHRYFPETSGWLLLLIPPFQPRFYPLITLFFLFFLHFYPFITDNCNFESLFRKGIKMKIFTFYNNWFKN